MMADAVDERREVVNDLRAREDVRMVDFTRDGFGTVIVRARPLANAAAIRAAGEGLYEDVSTDATEQELLIVFSSSERPRLGGNRL